MVRFQNSEDTGSESGTLSLEEYVFVQVQWSLGSNSQRLKRTILAHRESVQVRLQVLESPQ